MKDLSWEFIVSNVVECMRIIGTKPMYYSDKEIIEIKNHKGYIPPMVMGITGVFKVQENNDLVAMHVGEDILHDHYGSFNSAPSAKGGYTYSLNNNCIFPNFDEGKVLIVYDAIATDEECFPLIPDNAELIRALRAYVKYQWFDILNDMDKISDRKLDKAETDYSYYVGQAQSNLQMPSIDEMEALVNSITKILPSRTEHANRFQFLASQEYLNIQ